MATSVGKIYAEIDLDTSLYMKSQAGLLKSATQVTTDIESNFKTLGINSANNFDLMRARIQNAYDGIAHGAKATTADIVAAEKAKTEKIQALNDQQFGKQTSMLATLKSNWIAASASVYAAWRVMGEAFDLIKMGAKAQQAEESFQLVSASANESAESILTAMKKASAGTVDDSDIMQKAVKGMILGLSGDQMAHIMEAARLAARVSGEDVLTAYEKITDAISTGLPRGLKQYGLITKEEMALVSKALKLGITDVNLYVIAMDNYNIQLAKYGALQDNATEKLQRWTAGLKDLKETVGKWMINTLASFDNIFTLGSTDSANDSKKATEAAKQEAAVKLGIAEQKKKFDIDEVNRKVEAAAAEAGLLKALLTEYKKTYETQVEMAEHASQMKVLAGQNELNFALQTIQIKEAAALQEYNNSVAAVNAHEKNEVLKKETLEKLAIEYNLQITKLKDQEEATAIKVDNAIRDSSENAYIEMSMFSKQSIDAQIAQIERKAKAAIIVNSNGSSNEDAINQATSAKLDALYENKLKTLADYYSKLTGYGNEYYRTQLDWIDTEQARLARFYNDDLAAAQWATDQKIALNQKMAASAIRAAGSSLSDFSDQSVGSNTSSANSTSIAQTNAIGGLSPGLSDYQLKQLIAGGSVGRVGSGPGEQDFINVLFSGFRSFMGPQAQAAKNTAMDVQSISDAANKATATANAVTKAQDIATKNYNLEVTALESTGDAVKTLAVQRAVELSTLDDSLKPLQQRIYDLQDEATATATATALAKSKTDLEIKLMTAQGDAAGALALTRQKELDATDDTLKPLQQLVYLTEDWATALANATSATVSAIDAQISAATTLAQTARSTASAYDTITNSLTDAIDKIKGTAGSGSNLDSLFSKAMTGDQKSLTALPSAVDAFLSASLTSAKTSQDYALAQGKALSMLADASQVSIAGKNWAEYQATLLETDTNLLQQIRDELSQPNPDAALLKKQSSLLQTLAVLLQGQTTQIIAGNTYTVDQTGKIVVGNTLVGDQTAQVITGNATQDVIVGISSKSKDYSAAMLTALVMSGSTQTSSLTGILSATTLTTSLISQLIQLTAQVQADKAAAAVATANATAAANAAAAAAAAAALAAATAEANKAVPTPPPTSVQRVVTSTTPAVAAYDTYYYYQGTQMATHHPAVAAAEHGYILMSDGSHANAFAQGGDFGGGYRLVGERGPEIEYTGPSSILSNDKSKALFDNVVLIDEIRKLRAEVREGNTNRKKATKILDKFDITGMPVTRTWGY